MPIYEFYCGKCNTVYNFFSRTVNTEKVPDCPRCKGIKLTRRMSLFASVSGKKESGEADAAMPGFDEAKMGKAMAMLEKEAGGINQEDPRQAAALMRKLSDATGISMGSGMEEALRRLERGEDPEKIEAEMGDLIEGEEPFALEDKGKKGVSRQKAKVDEKLYEL
ncbi:MAG: zinc ribbon domain-containing protein [Nitrospiraceae bacterium]|nr:MAG: zinc ribbon domain-containing protein [Nitrospiraceae bacterium]